MPPTPLPLLQHQYPRAFRLKRKDTPLAQAAGNGHIDAVRYLLKSNQRGQDPQQALFVAAKHGQSEVVEDLLKDGHVDPNKTSNDGSSALIMAVRGGHENIDLGRLAIIQVLLRSGANIQGTNCHGRTALFETITLPTLEGPTLLLFNGINVSSTSNDGDSTFHATVICRTYTLTPLLLNQGVEVDPRDKHE